MSAIEKLKTKIEETHRHLLSLQEENRRLREQAAQYASYNPEETAALRRAVEEKSAEVIALKNEIAEKDTEIEAIIAKVEALLA